MEQSYSVINLLVDFLIVLLHEFDGEVGKTTGLISIGIESSVSKASLLNLDSLIYSLV